MPQLHYLRERVTRVRRMAKGKVHVPEDLQLPDDVIQVLELGPKFGLQSERTNPELLTVLRQVARRATEGEEERITSEGLDAISRCKPAIEEHVSDALSPTYNPPPISAPLTYAEAARRSLPSPPTVTDLARQPRPLNAASPPTRRHRPPVRHPTPPSTNPWRTPKNGPICYFCHLPGHVARYCHRREYNPTAGEATYDAYRPEPPQPSSLHPTS
ncbi:hypothetical protein HPB51_013474 [Rhipicephalus microplus]|uniref:Tick transposon n=1 Tax=Rhipicephalus microplus TaxID=6941 RepID=A0A9J6DUL9_RHIMP|nr:hypothetical protein HPB51_013474 [Rhipicephalus microplus]